MKKMAFFVEGFTEMAFLCKYISEVYDKSKISITSMKVKGGSSVPISFGIIKAKSVAINNTNYHILIYNCGGETTLRTYIINQRKTLIKEGFSRIIGIRDVFPNNKREDIHTLMKGLKYKLPQTEITIDFILSIMEIEAYFLCEHTHYSKINPSLNSTLIKANLSFDPEIDNMESLNNPAKDLHDCYQLVGESYTKDNNLIERTIDTLNFAELYFNHSNTYSTLGRLKAELDTFLDVN